MSAGSSTAHRPDTAEPDPTDPVASLVYPTRRDEAWRYAPHALLGGLSFGPSPQSPASPAPALVDAIPALDGPRIVIVDGVVDAALSDLHGAAAGLVLSSLAIAAQERPQLVAAHHDHGTDDAPDAFSALNAAFGHDGAVIDVAADVTLDAPVHVVHIASADSSERTSCSGVVIRLGAGASASVVETSIGDGTAGGTNNRTTVILGADASLDHVVLQDVAANQVHLGRIAATQESGSTFRSQSFNLGGAYGRIVYDVELAGDGARAELSGLCFGTGSQTLDHQITIVHAAPNCVSRQRFRSVLDDESTGVFNGGIDVRPGADGTDAEQANDNLLLSDRAEANTQPRLEILADEVSCKHGATVGQLDETALYYLRTRGIGEATARQLLIRGFADEAVGTVDNEVVQAWIAHRLGDHDG